jgi:hypothetical protein
MAIKTYSPSLFFNADIKALWMPDILVLAAPLRNKALRLFLPASVASSVTISIGSGSGCIGGIFGLFGFENTPDISIPLS